MRGIVGSLLALFGIKSIQYIEADVYTPATSAAVSLSPNVNPGKTLVIPLGIEKSDTSSGQGGAWEAPSASSVTFTTGYAPVGVHLFARACVVEFRW
jgi:hypothetical protein